MSVSERRLYDLLPAVYRVRDAALGGPLQALLAAAQEEADRLEGDLEQLYDDWFIETCEEWVVPYIGNLLGVDGLSPVAGAEFSQRGFVANTLAYRRRKGTAIVLERLAHDVTGWPAHAVEFFKVLSVTQNINHVRLGAGGTATLADATALERVDGPFDPTAHTADVRHIDNGRGLYNVPDIGVFLWRLQAYPLDRTTASWGGGCYRFDPLGLDRPLFDRPRTKLDADDPATAVNVPAPLSRRVLRDELATDPLQLVYLDPADPAFAVWTGGNRIDAEKIAICDLTDPSREVPAGKDVAVDPRLGRFVFPTGATPAAPVECSWTYGFPADIGGGPYDRQDAVAEVASVADWQRGVYRDAPSGSPWLVETLGDAFAALAAENPRPKNAVIAVMDSRTYAENITLSVPAGTQVLLVAADWPSARAPVAGQDPVAGRIVASALRPCLLGDITVTGEAPVGDKPPGELLVDGLLIGGTIDVRPGALGLLGISNSTLVPANGGLQVEAGTEAADRNTDLQIELSRSISGPLRVHPFIRSLQVSDSILDGAGAAALSDATGSVGPPAQIDTTTVFGAVNARSLRASSTLFADRVEVERRQEGCVRYCYVSRDSLVPRRFRCQPADDASARRVVPAFVSADFADPAYAQLAATCPVEILTGAEESDEIGAYHLLAAAHRVASLRIRIDEYLRFGLEAGIFFAT